MAREDGVVRLDNGGGDLRGRVHGELELGFLAVVDREAFHEEGREAGAGTATEGMEDQETCARVACEAGKAGRGNVRRSTALPVSANTQRVRGALKFSEARSKLIMIIRKV